MTEVTQSPTSNSGNPAWLNPTNAYSSNNVYSTCGVRGAVRRFFDYGFDGVLPASISISKVEVGIEFYCLATEVVKIRISVDGGVTWSAWSTEFTLTTEAMLWVNVTAYKAWLRSYLLDANWRIEIVRQLSGAGVGCPEKEAWTVHLDWIPTRVTYEEVAVAVEKGLIGPPHITEPQVSRPLIRLSRYSERQRTCFMKENSPFSFDSGDAPTDSSKEVKK